MKATIWYITRNEDDYLRLSVLTHEKYDWVDQIVIFHTDEKPPGIIKRNDFTTDKISHFWCHFGTGFEKSVEDGGFDEIEARNLAIHNARDISHPGAWLIQCDSDEFFTYDTKEQIEIAQYNEHSGIRISCNHFMDPLTVKFPKADPHDFHLRIWKVSESVRYIQNPNGYFMRRFANKSNHCVPVGCSSIKEVVGLHHAHVKAMILKKREKNISGDCGLKKVPINIFNELYLDTWNLENEVKYYAT